ncbi:hypothetical protein ASE48_08420 [Mycobacterium sp. Root265]|uniref:hypothetical protein n=1 Tax=Mycobacterium sp. Root265 TaxID=1736504 RepID=UPI00070F40F3|nr:hypothetical protein [Mycobacterium sp. Root265]KRD08581.1 hypothetical protein ASE48_08420 [Mycobacterium sp. Root265]
MTKIRQYFYLASGLVGSLLPILTLVKLISSEQAVTIASLTDNLGSLLGGGAAITAGVILSRQRADGTVGAEAITPLEAVIANAPLVVQAAADAAAELEKLKVATAEIVGTVPVYGKEAADFINSLPKF